MLERMQALRGLIAQLVDVAEIGQGDVERHVTVVGEHLAKQLDALGCELRTVGAHEILAPGWRKSSFEIFRETRGRRLEFPGLDDLILLSNELGERRRGDAAILARELFPVEHSLQKLLSPPAVPKSGRQAERRELA